MFPLVLQSATADPNLADVLKWIQQSHGDLGQKLRQHGVILFRGFRLTTPQDFDAFVSAFGYENFPYDESFSNAVRINLTPRVFTANEAPCQVRIDLHHEMAQTPKYPGKLFFFCQKPADQGGATVLCPSDVLFEKLRQARPDFVRAGPTRIPEWAEAGRTPSASPAGPRLSSACRHWVTPGNGLTMTA